MSLWKSPWASEQGRTGPWLGSPWRSQRGRIWTRADLFKSGEQGAWYDPSDLSTLFQDAAGTTPVTADGDPVGLMLDKSGNGNHASQSVSASRPVYRTDGVLHWLEFDGVDDFLSTPTITHTSKQLLMVGAWQNNSQDEYKQVLSLGGSASYRVGFAGNSGISSNGRKTINVDYDSTSARQWVEAQPAPHKNVISTYADRAINGKYTRVDGVEQTYIIDSGSLIDKQFDIAPLTVHNYVGLLYGLVLRLGDDSDVAQAESYFASKAGLRL